MTAKNPTKKELTERIFELEEDLKRAQADAINIRRRSEEDKVRIGTFAKKDVISKLLPVLDNLDRAIKSAPEDLAKTDYVKGLLAIEKQLDSTLHELGVEKIKAVGEPFNPETMEAVAVDGDGDTEVVSEELQSGYTLNDHVIRTATVKVTKQ